MGIENKAFSKENTKAAIEKIITLTNMIISPTENGILFSTKIANASYGYDYVSVRQIASEANVNIGSISYYFQNNAGILQKILEDFYKGLNLFIRPIIDDATLKGLKHTKINQSGS